MRARKVRRRPDLPRIYKVEYENDFGEQVRGWRIAYGEQRGWETVHTFKEAVEIFVEWHDCEIDTYILYLDELRRNRNKFIYQYNNLQKEKV